MSTNRAESPVIEYEYQRILARHKELNPMLFATEEVDATHKKMKEVVEKYNSENTATNADVKMIF